MSTHWHPPKGTWSMIDHPRARPRCDGDVGGPPKGRPLAHVPTTLPTAYVGAGEKPPTSMTTSRRKYLESATSTTAGPVLFAGATWQRTPRPTTQRNSSVKKKTHYPLSRCQQIDHPGAKVSGDPTRVTCKACRRWMIKHRPWSRSDFPAVPTFEVQAEGRFRNRSGRWGCHLKFTCPLCGRRNTHGGFYDRPSARGWPSTVTL